MLIVGAGRGICVCMRAARTGAKPMAALTTTEMLAVAEPNGYTNPTDDKRLCCWSSRRA